MGIVQNTLNLVRIQPQDWLCSTYGLSMFPGLVCLFPRALSLMSPTEHPETLFALPVASTLQIPTKDVLSYSYTIVPHPRNINPKST